MPRDELTRRIEHFQEVLRQSGIPVTHQRLEVFREVAKSVDHPDVGSVYRGVRKRVPTISLDTVYRTVWLLLDLGLVATLGQRREKARFDANLSSHHHFICSQCGMTRDFYSEDFDGLEVPESVQSFGQVETTYVEVRGVCLRCVGKSGMESGNSKHKEDES